MQLLRQRMWRTPFGFHRYTEYGQKVKTYREDQFKMHEERKKKECISSIEITSKIAEYTEQGIRWAKQLSLYLAQTKNSKHSRDDLNLKIQFAVDKIQELVSFGANLDSVQPHIVDN